MWTRRTQMVLGSLLVVWLGIVLWQIDEHKRVKDSASASLFNRAQDISTSLSVVIRSQRPFIGQLRLEAALEELTKSSELKSAALLNSVGEVVASGGEQMDFDLTEMPEKGYRWAEDQLIVRSPVDLGASEDADGEARPAPIVFPEYSTESATGEVRLATDMPFGRPDFGRHPFIPRDATPSFSFSERDRSPDRIGGASGRDASDERDRGSRDERRGPRRDWRSRRFGRAPWMSEEEYATLLTKRGLHDFVLVLSTDAYKADVSRDYWLRFMINGVTFIAAVGLGLAWRSMERSTNLQMRLIRTSEMNVRLREMNVVAGGLAHETRNPLNIVRGLAQMISKRADASEEVRARSHEIADEVDRVTARMNEFLEYSKPREARPTPIRLDTVVRDVDRTLEVDKEEKGVEFLLTGPELAVYADEPLLRQVLFNLLHNSIQAVGRGGKVEVSIEQHGSDEASFEVRDDGPGVPAEIRENIFKPYFTTQKSGTGLGLAIVRQIVLAHGWEIGYIPGAGKGSRFRITGLKTAPRT